MRNEAVGLRHDLTIYALDNHGLVVSLFKKLGIIEK